MIVLSVICLIVGFAGCFLPMLPGPPVAYAGLLLLHMSDLAHFTVTQLIVWGFMVLFVQVADYLTPVLGSKYSGGSQYGNWGCVVGTLLGIFFFPPWGILFGPFIGAFVGELMGGKGSSEAFRAGFGAFTGFLLSVVIKVALCGYFVYCFIAGVT